MGAIFIGRFWSSAVKVGLTGFVVQPSPMVGR